MTISSISYPFCYDLQATGLTYFWGIPLISNLANLADFLATAANSKLVNVRERQTVNVRRQSTGQAQKYKLLSFSAWVGNVYAIQ